MHDLCQVFCLETDGICQYHNLLSILCLVEQRNCYFNDQFHMDRDDEIRQIIKYHKLLYYIEFMSKLLVETVVIIKRIDFLDGFANYFSCEADKHFSFSGIRNF